jgi:hypothetical protein
MPSLSPHILSYVQINQKAQDFLKKHHPSLSLPIPIEDIIELDLGIKITAYIWFKGKF